MSWKSSAPKETTLGAEKKAQTQQGSGTMLWTNQDEMKRYVSKLKSDLDEQKNRVKRVHRDKAEEIKRLQENLDNERQKAIENVAKKLESDKAYELKKLREAVVKQKESELREILRLKDEEMRVLKQELQESKSTSRTLELENKRILSERSRGDTNDQERRLRNEITTLKHNKRKLEESLRIKTEADFEKAEIIRKMKYEHDAEVQRLARESKRESLKEFRHLKAASREIEVKNHQLAAKEAEMRRLEMEKDTLGNELNLHRKKRVHDNNLATNNSFSIKKTEADFDNVAEDRIKKLKMRNSELVAIARKLEEKAKRLQEEKDILEKSNGQSPELGNLKKAFARQRAKDLAEHAKLLMNKDHEISTLKKEVQGSCNGFPENENVDELAKIVEQSAKERLLLEKQLTSKEEVLSEQIKELRDKNSKLSNDNEMLKAELSGLRDVEAEHFKAMFEMNRIREENNALQHAASEKDNIIFKLGLEQQAFVAQKKALQKKNNELSTKVSEMEKLEKECATLRESLQSLKNEHGVLTTENSKLREQVESLCALKKEVERLKQENQGLQKEKEDSVLKLEERQNEISCLHQAQEEAQKKHDEQVSELSDMLLRLETQSPHPSDNNDRDSRNSPQNFAVLSSTPKDTKFTQTSRATSPTLSPIIDTPQADEVNNPTEFDSNIQDSLRVPDYGTSSSASFDLEKASSRIDQLAASDSGENDFQSTRRRTESPSLSSELSSVDSGGENLIGADEDTSYSADVSHTSDLEQSLFQPKDYDQKDAIDSDDQEDAGVFIGSPSPEVLDIEEKLSIFIAKYSYDPMLYSPNENPETELAFQAGDYLYVYGDVDEDGFYVGELMNGDRGLVPSNFVERIAEDEAILKGSEQDDNEDDSEDDSSEEEITLKDEDGKQKVIRPKAFSERRHEMFRTSLDHVLNDHLDDIRESEEEDLGNSSLSEEDLFNKNRRNERTEVDQNFSHGLDSTDSDVHTPRVPSPSKLSLDRQFTTSALISWRGATLPSDEIQGYNIYVNGKFKTQTKGSRKTSALVEDIDPNETYRLSVRTNSVGGKESPDNDATMTFGPDAKLSPYNLHVHQTTETSAEVRWIPANSSYAHDVFLDDSLLFCVRPSICTYTFSELSPSSHYRVGVRTHIPDQLRLTLGKAGTDEYLMSEVEFTSCAGGLPEPPVDVRLDQRNPENIILTWLPVTISTAGYSNGFKVTGYKVYVNGIYCTETDSYADSVHISNERLSNLGKRHDFTTMRFVVRTQSVLGESVDSNAVEVISREISDSTASHFPTNTDDRVRKEVKTNPEAHAASAESGDNASRERGGGTEPALNNVLSDLARTASSSEELSEASSDLETRGKAVEEEREQDDLHRTCEDSRAGDENHLQNNEHPSTVEDGSLSTTDASQQVNNRGSEQGIEPDSITSNGSSTVASDRGRKLVVVRYDIEDDETESDSFTAESVTETEELVEIFVDAKANNVENGSLANEKHMKDLTPDDVPVDIKEMTKTQSTLITKQLSESETETESDELLSVIHEVDEENLTVTNTDSSTETPEIHKEASTVSKDQAKAGLSNTSKNSVGSGSKSRTFTSDDEGFRTEDDVLDLLNDDDSEFAVKTPKNAPKVIGKTGAEEVTDGEMETAAKKDVASDSINNTFAIQPQANRTSSEPHKVENNEASLVPNQAAGLSPILSEEVELNKGNTAVESNDDASESNPTTSSFNSDSSTSISEAPPPADEALETIIKTLSLPGNREPGTSSNDVSGTTRLGTGYERTSDLFSDSCRSESETGETVSELIRYFVALYSYDPLSMSPNADGADEELPFNEGDLIKVFGDKDDDGFFWGECRRTQGFVPSNMVSEVPIDEAEDLFNEVNNSAECLEQSTFTHEVNGHCEIDVDVVAEDFISRISTEGPDLKNRLSFWETVGNDDLAPRTMRALFDYNPVQDSPNVDSEVELMFKSGEIIYVFGGMDDDGFFQGELHGVRGLVPSNFLEPVKDSEYDPKDASQSRESLVSPTKTSTPNLQENQPATTSAKLPNGTTKGEEEQHKKKKGLFSKGKKIFKKAFR